MQRAILPVRYVEYTEETEEYNLTIWQDQLYQYVYHIIMAGRQWYSKNSYTSKEKAIKAAKANIKKESIKLAIDRVV